MNLRNHLHVFFWGGEPWSWNKNSPFQKMCFVPKRCSRYVFMGSCLESLVLRNAYLWPVWNPRSQKKKTFEKFQIMEPKQRKNWTLRHFKSKPLTTPPPPNKKKMESHQGPLWQKLHVARLFAKPTFQFLHVWTPAWRSVVLGPGCHQYHPSQHPQGGNITKRWWWKRPNDSWDSRPTSHPTKKTFQRHHSLASRPFR